MEDMTKTFWCFLSVHSVILGYKSARASRGRTTGTMYIALLSRPAGNLKERRQLLQRDRGLPERKRLYCFLRLSECLSWTENGIGSAVSIVQLRRELNIM